jgi:dTDP-4-amino-4,6-dideoxy-D-glucose transaminase
VKKSPLYVTRPLLPPLEAFIPYLREIWDSGQVTNSGVFHARLEKVLADYLEVEHISLLANGTMALMTAIKALNVTGEVITTPFSFVATAHALRWNGIAPVFVDIDPDTLSLDPKAVEAAITPSTTAILPVHVYGRPCDVKALQRIADRYGLKLIYDAAHAFGVRCCEPGLLLWGDLSVLSFHATKVFHTFEGGAVVCLDAEMKQKIDYLKNFGFAGETSVVTMGINAKMNELQAAFGLLHLQHLDAAIARRQGIDAYYRHALGDTPGIRCLSLPEVTSYNYGYFPILVESAHGRGRDELYRHLRGQGIYVRRYFFPLISDFPMYRNNQSSGRTPVAQGVADKVLCLPIYPDMSREDCERVIGSIREFR